MATTTTDYPTTELLIEQSMQFYQRGLVGRGISFASAKAATAKGTERHLTVSAFAQMVTVLLANARAGEDATLPDTAAGEDLERWCALFGLARSSGAGAQGSVLVTCSGSVTYPADLEAVGDKNGKRYRVVTSTTTTSGGSVPVVGVDVGTVTNLAAGETLTWTSPPNNSATTCVVAAGGLVNGQDADTDGRLRERLLKLLREPQNGGSWAHYRKWAEDASAAVQDAYVYPALQGPGTTHVAYTVEGTRENDYARAGTLALTLLVANAVVSQQPEYADATVTTVAHGDLLVTFKLTLPEPIEAGGPGGGWVNKSADRWPLALTSAPYAVKIASVGSSSEFTINGVATLPTPGTTEVALFDSTNREVLRALVTAESHTGSGPYNVTITIDQACPTLIAGDYVFPACEQQEAYAATFQEQVAELAPGEKTSNAAVLPRAYRHPRAVDGEPSGLTTRELVAMQTEHPEVVNASYHALDEVTSWSLPLEPALPASVTDPPNVWRVKKFAVYPA